MQTAINLATRRYYNRRLLRGWLLCLLALLLLLSILGARQLIGYRAESYKLAAAISALDKRLAAPPSGVAEKEFSLHSRQVASLNSILAQRRSSRRALLDALEQATPNGVAYTAIVPDTKEKTVKLEGRVRSLALLSDLLERLGNTGGIKTPTLLSTDDNAQHGMPGAPVGIRFVISLGWDTP
ncbi:PilN domain-containing protein [Trichlorobacter lovleyi]|uniref:Fimbrial assembly family protein n=1 Tax=Trichlorobacter lovleyi (strain ATCC BAA-1151 / DSM 17278 / SZ) TaxID=398767 RepID=B3E8R6_TRIL1|nr:PilN domain-containing protein [Trichlorobacter lovleyi]ACD95184.1 Fimbrial assembly family protein [Trichlorobacter lovleyi SZ]